MKIPKKKVVNKTVSPNWTPDEEAVLNDIASQHASLLDSKFNSDNSKADKDKIWNLISKQVSAVGIYPRPPKACKRKWQNKKSVSGKKVHVPEYSHRLSLCLKLRSALDG